MAVSNFNEYGLNISKEIVDKFFPDESHVFAIFKDSFLEESKVAQESNNEFGLGFGGDVDLQEYITPNVILAVFNGIKIIIDSISAKQKEKKEKSDSNYQASVDKINLVAVEREVFDLLRKRKIGKERAETIAREFVSLVLKDPNIFLSTKPQ